MGDQIEALGALATAGLAASELDKPSVRRRLAQERAAHEGLFGRRAAYAVAAHPPGTCANCEVALVGDFCHACGQQRHVHRSVGHVFEEFLHGIWHFDSKAWRTLPLLALRPGTLTWNYIHGKRARFVAPIAMFLLSFFLMFFVFGFVGAPDIGGSMGSQFQTKAEAQAAATSIARDVADSEAKLAAARRSGDVEAIRNARNSFAAERIALRLAQDTVRSFETGPDATARPSWVQSITAAIKDADFEVETAIPGVDDNIRAALRNPELAIYRVQQKAYKLSFLLIPLSLPVLWLMFFWRRDTTTYDHVVFVLYSLSFMSLLLVFAVLFAKASNALAGVGGPEIDGLAWLLLVPPIHMFFQLKGGYRLSGWGALWRTVVLTHATLVIPAIFAALIVIVGLAD